MEAVNIYPEIIKWKQNKQGLVNIVIRFDFNRQPIARIPLGHKILPGEWDNNSRRVKKINRNHELLNQLIENVLNKHTNFVLKRQTFNLPLTKEMLKDYAQGGNSFECFFEYAEKVIENKKLNDGKHYNEDTKRRYRTEIKLIKKFKPDLNFSKITLKFLEDYKGWLQTVYKKKNGGTLDKNSIWKTFSTLRMIYNQAIKDEVILPDNNPFKKFDVGRFATNFERIKFLDILQIDKLENILSNNAVVLQDLTIRVGWRFLSMCVSGLRISDAMLLNDATFNDAGDLEFTPVKTQRYGNKAQVPIVSDRQKRYLAKTIEQPLPETHSNSFRTTFNIHLKILCAAAGIPAITSHSGRHTMGSLLVDAGVQDKSAMAMLGVKSERVIRTYMHLKESKLKTEAEKLKSIL